MDRIDVGDAAKLREACANIAEYARSAQCHTEDAHVLGYLNQIEGWANVALAAPARNCDKYPTFNDAIRALADKRGWHDAKWNSERYCILASWLFAPATEQEGGNNG